MTTRLRWILWRMTGALLALPLLGMTMAPSSSGNSYVPFGTNQMTVSSIHSTLAGASPQGVTGDCGYSGITPFDVSKTGFQVHWELSTSLGIITSYDVSVGLTNGDYESAVNDLYALPSASGDLVFGGLSPNTSYRAEMEGSVTVLEGNGDTLECTIIPSGFYQTTN